MWDVTVEPCESYEAECVETALTRAIAPFGGLDWVKPGMKILIKPNLVAGKKPDSAVATHPAVVCALTKMIGERGGQTYIADSPGGPFTLPWLEHIYRATGMTQAESLGAILNRNCKATVRRADGAAVAKELTVCDYLKDMDAVINVCKLKTHGMMGLSAAAKNLFGIVPGTAKPECHYRYPDPMDFARMIVDLGEYVKPVLHICDGVLAMEGNGPTAGKARHLGVLLAARNPHALDQVCTRIIGCGEVPTLTAARERGLVPDEARVKGDVPEIGDWDIIRSFDSTRFDTQEKGIVAWARNRLLPILLRAKPDVKKNECVGCGKCGEICPAKAIVMRDGKPVIDRQKCIRCFCCQEFCPKGAMKVKRTVVAGWLQRAR